MHKYLKNKQPRGFKVMNYYVFLPHLQVQPWNVEVNHNEVFFCTIILINYFLKLT